METQKEEVKLNTYKQLVTDATVEFATLLHRLSLANAAQETPDDGFKELKFSVPMANEEYLHLQLLVNADKGMIKE